MIGRALLAPFRFVQRTYRRIREPRYIRLVYFVAYAVGIIGGHEAAVNAPTSLLPFFQGWAPYWSALILGGGAIGALTVFLKEWWVEIVGAIAIMGGYALYAVVVVSIHYFVEDSGNRLTQGTACALAAALFLLRVLMLRADISRLKG